MLRTKNIQKESSQTAQDTQETEGSDHPQQQDDLWVKTVIWKKKKKRKKHHKALQVYDIKLCFHFQWTLYCILTFQKLWVNVPQDIWHSQLLSWTSPSMDTEPGRFRQSCAKCCDRESSGQGRHQAPLRLLRQRGAPSSPPNPRNSRTRWGVHVTPILLLFYCLFAVGSSLLQQPLVNRRTGQNTNVYSWHYKGINKWQVG